MAVLLTSTSKNAIQKELASQLLSSAGNGDPISFDDVDGVPDSPGVLVINRVDANGESTPSKREYIEYSGTSGTTVLITTRNVDSSNAALTHAVGSIVEFLPDVTWAGRIYDALSTVTNTSDTSLVNTTNVVTPTAAQTLTTKIITGATLSGILGGNATYPGSHTFVGDVSLKRRKTPIYNNGTAGASLAIDLNNGETQKVILGTNATLSLVNMEEGDYLSLYTIQASGASASIAFFQSGGSIRYSGGASLPSITQSNNAVDLIGIRAFNASTSDVVAVVSQLT